MDDGWHNVMWNVVIWTVAPLLVGGVVVIAISGLIVLLDKIG